MKTRAHYSIGFLTCLLVLLVLPLASLHVAAAATTEPQDVAAKRRAIGHPTFMSPHANPIVVRGERVFVANTPADTIDVIDRSTREVMTRINVGIDPVGLAMRPDGAELWVANHVSDSVSVIDTVPASPTFLQVVATIQDFDPATKATRFDEPVGIAFASNEKAYVSLSSENQIAVIDVASRAVSKHLNIPAQDPRAIAVGGNRLYVVAFESGNQTQLSGGSKIDGDLVTFNAWNHSIRTNNVLSLGHVVDIVKHPEVPDRDLFVFDTVTDKRVETVSTVGTLLYGLAVDSQGRAYIAQADARNDVNGRSGTKKHGLAEMGNRAFLNRITRVDFKGAGGVSPRHFELEPLPPADRAPGDALATPFAIQVSSDDTTIVATASGSDKLFTVDANTGKVLGQVSVDSVPEGLALECDEEGKPLWAWVLNAAANTVSLVDVSQPENPELLQTILLEDPTHPVVKRGRIAFETARASTTQTFSCASCHPNAHTDQLLWVLATPIVTGGDQIMPRSTMPVRGLRDTEPFHWDGIPGDPYGGINSANLNQPVPPNSKPGQPETSTRFLIDAGLASTMHKKGDVLENDEGKVGNLTSEERDDMAKFLLGIQYPPAQRRAYDNSLSPRAQEGFRLFHIDGDNDPSKRRPNVCGNCHRMPFWVSTDTPGSGMDAPTWRGAYDRWLILPQGRLNIVDFPFYKRIAERGAPERDVWRMSWGSRERFDPIWDMVLEGSTGFSGSFARQVTLNRASSEQGLTADLLKAMERSHREGGIILQGEGVHVEEGQAIPVSFEFQHGVQGGTYRDLKGGTYRREQLLQLASKGRMVVTFTARLGTHVDADHPQPALWTQGPIQAQRGRQRFPTLDAQKTTMTISGRYIEDQANLIVDGRRARGQLSRQGETLQITLKDLPAPGMHFLQVQNPEGLFSNDFIFHVADGPQASAGLQEALEKAVSRGDLEETERLIARGAKINALPKEGGSPMSTAAYHGHIEILRLLLAEGGNPDFENRDGNTPLHVAAFAAEVDSVNLLLARGASTSKRNHLRQTPKDVVSGEWNEGTAGFYRAIGEATGRSFDLERIRETRPRIAKLLHSHAR